MKYNIKVCYPAFSGKTIFFGQRDFEYNVEVEAMSHHALLGRVFAAWNCGSGQECEAFLASKQRSLSVGDFVAIDGSWYRCEPMGWREALQTISQEEEDAGLRESQRTYTAGYNYACGYYD